MRFFGNLKLALGLFFACLLFTSAIDNYSHLKTPFVELNSNLEIKKDTSANKVVPISNYMVSPAITKIPTQVNFRSKLYFVVNTYPMWGKSICPNEFKVTLKIPYNYYYTYSDNYML